MKLLNSCQQTLQGLNPYYLSMLSIDHFIMFEFQDFVFDHSIHCQLMKSTSLQPVDEWGKDPLYSVSFSNFDLRLCSSHL